MKCCLRQLSSPLYSTRIQIFTHFWAYWRQLAGFLLLHAVLLRHERIFSKVNYAHIYTSGIMRHYYLYGELNVKQRYYVCSLKHRLQNWCRYTRLTFVKAVTRRKAQFGQFEYYLQLYSKYQYIYFQIPQRRNTDYFLNSLMSSR